MTPMRLEGSTPRLVTVLAALVPASLGLSFRASVLERIASRSRTNQLNRVNPTTARARPTIATAGRMASRFWSDRTP